MDRKLCRANFVCHNNIKGCLASATARVLGDFDSPDSYHLEKINKIHTCQDSLLDRLKEQALEKMKQRLSENPGVLTVTNVWRTVRSEMLSDLPADIREEFDKKLGSLSQSSKSLYYIKAATDFTGKRKKTKKEELGWVHLGK